MKSGIHKEKGGEVHYKNYEIHREDGPAVIYPDGRTEWWLNGKFHREDGPAVECPDGHMEWWIHGDRHREDGPAIVTTDRSAMWCQRGRFHREEGAAVELSDGTKEFWIKGQKLSPEDFAIQSAKLLKTKLDAMSNEQLSQVGKIVGKMLQLRNASTALPSPTIKPPKI